MVGFTPPQSSHYFYYLCEDKHDKNFKTQIGKFVDNWNFRVTKWAELSSRLSLLGNKDQLTAVSCLAICWALLASSFFSSCRNRRSNTRTFSSPFSIECCWKTTSQDEVMRAAAIQMMALWRNTFEWSFAVWVVTWWICIVPQQRPLKSRQRRRQRRLERMELISRWSLQVPTLCIDCHQT